MSDSGSMDGKTVLITGATDGIGKAAARELARQSATLVLVGRNAAKGAKVIEEIMGSAAPKVRPIFITADLSLISEVRKAATEILAKVQHLDVLINNAGAVFAAPQTTSEGLEMTFALNHVAPYILTNALEPLLRKSAPSRVITTSSEAHRGTALLFESLGTMPVGGYRGFRVYGQSKLANILFTKELAKRFDGSGVTANCFHPGIVRTGFGHNSRGLMNVALTLASPFLITPEKGAKTMVYLATDPDVATTSGEYFDKCHVKQPSAAARDDTAPSKLWETTQALLDRVAPAVPV